MCGIAGFAGQDRDKIERMTRAIAHRGPDAHAVALLPGASIGNRRLAILDPRPEGNQPMWNDARTLVLTFNGEIYNFKELREEEKFICKTNTDTEVILRLYERHGMAFLPRLRGMFAFGLYDTRTRSWHLARDANGILPLFVATFGGQLHFASEMRALLTALPAKPALNTRALSQYLQLQYVPGPQTLCEGIEALPPGTHLEWQDGTETRTPFSPLTLTQRSSFHNPAEFRAAFPAIMDDAVKAHLVSDKPVGLFLSGGMDSSILLHHMAAHAAKPLRTFTVRFEATEQEGAKRFNTDADLARLTAAHYGSEHTELLMTAASCRDVYRDTAQALDQPNADSVAMAQFLLAREAKKHVDVVLCGAGGDELFGGYPRYRIARILHALRFVPPALRSAIGKAFGHPPDVLALSPGSALALRLLARPPHEATAIVRGEWFDPAASARLFDERFAQLHTPSPIRDFMEFDRHLWLVDESLRLADAVTLGGNGLECRPPFLDPAVIAASHATPAHWHVTLGRTKALLKDTYRPLLPPHLFALKKASFYPPLAKWFRREMRPLFLESLEHPRIRELFDVDALRSIEATHLTGERYALHTLASITQLRFWFETVYDAPRMIITQPDRVLLTRQIARFAPQLSGRILDAGSGRSRRYANLCGQVTEYLTLDLDPQGNPDILGSIEAIPLPDASIDAVICTQVLEHVPHPQKALAELHRVLKPGGRCLLTVPQWNELHEVPHDYFRYTCYGLRVLFEDAGFEVDTMDQRGGYHALRGQIRIRHLIETFRPYERKAWGYVLGPLSLLLTRWALWRDREPRSRAASLHAIGWCVLARKRLAVDR